MPDYCSAADLKKAYADIDRFDLKVTLDAYSFVEHSSPIYKLHDSGYVGRLYRAGADLGDAEVNLVAVDAEDEWFYDSTTDTLYVQVPSGSVTDWSWKAAYKAWATVKTEAITNAAGWLEDNLDPKMPRPIPMTTRTGGDYSYDYSIVLANALLACILIVRGSDPKHSIIPSLERQVFDPDVGLVSRINSGDMALSFEWTRSDGGFLEEGSTDSPTTGRPVDPVGTPLLDGYNRYKLEIVDAGTVTAAVDNETVTYKVTDVDGQEVVADTLINQKYQTAGGGMQVRWLPGVYSADDYWWLSVQTKAPSTSQFQTMRLHRRM